MQTHARNILSFALALFAAAVFVQPALAASTVPAIGWADGEELAFYPDPNDPNLLVGEWEATGDGTVIGIHITRGITRFNLATGELTGEFLSESLEFPGTSIRGRYTANAGILIPDTFTIFRSNLSVEWFDGEGLLENATGKGIVRNVEDETGGLAGTGAFHYEFRGFFRLP